MGDPNFLDVCQIVSGKKVKGKDNSKR